MIRYYAVRRVNPYLGVIQVIDTGVVRAYSSSGERWQPRRVYDSQQFWSVSEASHNCGFELLPKDALLAAIRDRPAMPFPLQDRYEFWLLHKQSRMPLALLKTCHWERDMGSVQNPVWRPFPPGESRFQVPFLRNRAQQACSALECQAELERMVNYAARPQPSAQWFRRHDGGAGEGLNGLRVEAELVGRHLPADGFPELLVAEYGWPEAIQHELVMAFHDHLAPLLLVHQSLHVDTRARLERATQAAPARLVESYRMIPELLDEEGMAVAMVTAKLMNAGEAGFI